MGGSMSNVFNGSGEASKGILKGFQSTSLGGAPPQYLNGSFSSTAGPVINSASGSYEIQMMDAENIMENINKNPQGYSTKNL